MVAGGCLALPCGREGQFWGAIAEHEQRQEREAATKEALEREWWNWG